MPGRVSGSRSGLTCAFFEQIDHLLAGLSHFDDITIRVSHVASQFPTMIIERFSQEISAFSLPFSVASLDVCNS
jgi:hypothetical protein